MSDEKRSNPDACGGSGRQVPNPRTFGLANRYGSCPVCGRMVTTRWNGRLYRHGFTMAVRGSEGANQ